MTERELPPLSAKARVREFGANFIANEIRLLRDQKLLPNPTVDLDKLRGSIVRHIKNGGYDIKDILKRLKEV